MTRTMIRTHTTLALATLAALGLAAAPAAHAQQTLYVSTNANTIDTFSSTGTVSQFATDPGDGSVLDGPQGLAFDRAGNLYAANSGNNTIEKFTTGGVGTQFASIGLNQPTGLAFDSAGNLYAANNGDSTITEFPASGGALIFASTGLNGPAGLAFDSAGNLYAANSGNNTIEKFTPGGVGTQFASEPNAPQFLAFGPAAAPEPSQFAAFGVGLLGLGALALRARKHQAA